MQTNEMDYRTAALFYQDSKDTFLQNGTFLKGRYRINHVIGQGGFGITYDGTDLKLDMHVAIKEYFPRMIANRHENNKREVTSTVSSRSMYERGRRNFLEEARNMAKFVGEVNFVTVHDYFEENNTAYIIMEYVQGENLRYFLRQRKRLSIEEVMRIIIPVMDALERIHIRGMIHRDISPSNIMIMPDGRIKLLDFGAVRDLSLESRQLTTMSAVYKQGYSPIEQQTGDMRQGTYSDIYALCATIYEMLTGSIPLSPFSRLSENGRIIPPSALGVRIEPAQEAAILKGLEIYGKDRIQTVGELRIALCGRRSVRTKHNWKIWRGSKWIRRGREQILRVILAGAAAVLVISLGFLITRLFYRRDDESRANKLYNSDRQLNDYQAKDGDISDANDSINQTKNESEKNHSILKDGIPLDFDSVASKQDQGMEKSIVTEDNQESKPDLATLGSLDEEESEEESAAVMDDQDDEEVSVSGRTPGMEAPSDTEEYQDMWDAGIAEESLGDTSEQSSLVEEEPVYDYPIGTLSYGGHHYYIYDDVETSWEDAMAECHRRGGYLAVINDSMENDELFQYMQAMGYDTAFFGLVFRNGGWEYIDEDTSDFRDWGVNSRGVEEPNNTDGGDIHVCLDTYMQNGHWNDVRYGRTDAYIANGSKYNNLHTYICEWDE